jgi:hypothetical protein
MVDTSTSSTYLQLNELIRVSISRILTNFTSPKAIILLSEAQIQMVIFNACKLSAPSSYPIAVSSDMKQTLQRQLTSSLQYWSSISGSVSGGGLGDSAIRCLQVVLGILSS